MRSNKKYTIFRIHQGTGNLVLLHFPPNFEILHVEWRNSTTHLVFLPERGYEIIYPPLVEIEPVTVAVTFRYFKINNNKIYKYLLYTNNTDIIFVVFSRSYN